MVIAPNGSGPVTPTAQRAWLHCPQRRSEWSRQNRSAKLKVPPQEPRSCPRGRPPSRCFPHHSGNVRRNAYCAGCRVCLSWKPTPVGFRRASHQSGVTGMCQITRAAMLLAGMMAITQSSWAQIPQANKGDWPWWRGPYFNGVAESDQQPPTSWSPTENVAWKAAVPGRGHSTPIVVGNRVFLQTADETTRSQSVLCSDRRSGESLWRKELNRNHLQEKINPKNIFWGIV